MRLAMFEVDGEIIPAFSKSVSSCLSLAWCLWNDAYVCFWFKGLILSLGQRDICTRSVLPISVMCLEKMSS